METKTIGVVGAVLYLAAIVVIAINSQKTPIIFGALAYCSIFVAVMLYVQQHDSKVKV